MSKTYAPGDFSFWNSSFDEAMYKNAYDAITAENLWDFLKDNSPPEDRGFMFWSAPELKCLHKHMDPIGHSGASYGITMRAMESIAKNGWHTYVAMTIKAIEDYQREKEKEEALKKLEEEVRKKEETLEYRRWYNQYIPAHLRKWND
jgi:hypothetical protein